MANFEAIDQVFSSSTNLFFLKSVIVSEMKKFLRICLRNGVGVKLTNRISKAIGIEQGITITSQIF